MNRGAYILAGLLATLAFSAVSARVSAADDLEYRVKAAFLYNFARFIEWPAAGGSDGPMQVCTYLTDPFGSALQSTLKDKLINGRSIQSRNVASVADATECEILFVPSDVSIEDSAFLLDQLKGQAILTVGENSAFNRSGGVVRFLIEDGKVRFEINLAAARQSNLQISSKLLRVAKTIEGNGNS